MIARTLGIHFFLLLVLAVAWPSAAAEPAPPAANDYSKLLPAPSTSRVDFVRDIRPLLKKHCFDCHAEGNEEGGLNLGVRQRAFEGGVGGPVLAKGDSARSRLIHFVAGVDKAKLMPPEGEKLTAEQIGLLRAWIDQGAVWPDGSDILDPRLQRARDHWAFQPLRDVALPDVRAAGWCRNPIDHFLKARLEAAGLEPSAPADPRQLMRRVSFDVTGLPPSPDDVASYCAAAERDPNATYAALVDRLLVSRHYGERWGRHWLDLAHYADSDGMESDRDRPHAFHYRDFVIRALNDDLPYDQFVRWQLAGDEFEPRNPAAVAATGFLATGPHEVLDAKLLEQERLRSRYNELDDMLSTIGTGMLGLTIGCARCHDHKYDAIASRDYYRLLAAFHSGDRAEVPIGADGAKTLAYRDFGAAPKPTWLFRRADFYDRRQTVQLGFLELLTRGRTIEEYWNQARSEKPLAESTYQRRALAEWITDVEHGAGALLARVFVNRLWQHHFGEALVPTVGDFGVRAAPPSHPELLEWLAHDLVRNGWKTKRLHRLMLTSAAYQQTSFGAAAQRSVDPENRLLWKMNSRRLEAEILRDALLEVSGTLNREPFGPAFKPPIASEAMLARNLKDPYPANLSDSPAVRRRSVYMFHKRVVPYPLLQAFDKPDAQQSCGRRDRTTVAPQALTLLNDPFVRGASRDFADRLLKEGGNEPARWIERAYQLALGRAPNATESQASREFLDAQFDQRTRRKEPVSADENRRRALADYCQALFSLNEFLYVD